MGLNLVLDFLHNNMHRLLLLSAGMRGKHVCHFLTITSFSTLHVVERLAIKFRKKGALGYHSELFSFIVAC